MKSPETFPGTSRVGVGDHLAVPAQLDAVGLTEEPTKEKVLLALEPRVVMAAMHTTTIRANITAYSTAVGPSSAFRNDTKLLVKPRMLALQIGVAHVAPVRNRWYSRPDGRQKGLEL